MNYALLYYISTLLGPINFLAYLFVILCVFILIAVFGLYDDKIIKYNTAKFTVILSLLLFVVSLTVCIFVPSQKDFLIITGLHLGSDGINQLLADVPEFYELLKDQLPKKD